MKLVNFAVANRMVISSTIFRRKNIHKATWLSPDSKTKTQIDHLLIDARHASDVLNVRTYRCTATDVDHHDSDHFLLGAKIRARISNVYQQKGTKCRRINVAQLQEAGKRNEFRTKLAEKLERDCGGDAEWSQISDAMGKVAEEVLGFQVPVRNEWFDDDCQKAVQAVIEARKVGRESRTKSQHIRKLQREKKKMLRRKKRQFDQQKLAEIESLYTRNDTRKFYQAVNAEKRGFQPRTSMCKAKGGDLICHKNGILDRWREYFHELLNVDSGVRQQNSSKRPYEGNDGKECSAPSREDVISAINSLKNNKAPGNDSLSAELFKAGGSSLVDHLNKLVERCWSEEKLPNEWKMGVICPIFKKGCKLECKNYRGISLLPTAYKILSIILAERLKPLMENFLQPYQAGFRRGMSTTDQIFCIRQIIQKSYAMNTETDHLFIDFKQAYDTIDREQLWGIMVEFGFPFKLIRLLKATLTDVKSCVKVDGQLSEAFDSEIGLRQGDGISTMLFNIALEGVIRRSKIETGGSIFVKSTQVLAFADDIDIIGRNIRAVKDAYCKLEKEANKIGLQVNVDKTKFLMVCPSMRTVELVGSHLEIEGKGFEVVNEFPYLGALMDNKFCTSKEITRRIITAQRAFYGLKHLLRSKNVTRKTKFAMYITLIRPVAIYGSESWNTTEEDLRQLGVFERKVLRTVIGPLRMSEGQYRIRYNHELYRIYNEPDIIAVVKHRRLSWAGHVMRRGDNEPVLMAFKGEFSDGKRSRGRQKNSWTEAVNKDSASFGLEDWRKTAKSRKQYRNFLDSVKARSRAVNQ